MGWALDRSRVASENVLEEEYLYVYSTRIKFPVEP